MYLRHLTPAAALLVASLTTAANAQLPPATPPASPGQKAPPPPPPEPPPSPSQKTPPTKAPPAPTPAALNPVELYGSLPDSSKAAAAPASRVIANDKDWVALTLAWGIKDAPKVDFTKELLVVATTRGDKLVIQTQRSDDGDLRISALDSDDNPRGGFRYGIKAVNRKGVKTVDGVPVPLD